MFGSEKYERKKTNAKENDFFYFFIMKTTKENKI